MKMNRNRRLHAGGAATLIALLLALTGCGGDTEETTTAAAPKAAAFPAVKGRTLEEVGGTITQSNLVAAPSGQAFEAGENRYAFGVFTKGRKPVDDAEVAVYFAQGKKGTAIGPFPATPESLETPPAYSSVSTSQDPSAARVVYVVPSVPFTAAGEWRAVAVFRTPQGLEGTLMPSAVVGRFPEIPRGGDPAPRIHTQTGEDVGGDLSKIDTRVPPDQMHKDDFAEVIGRKATVLLFATPSFCESRVCGPVVDIAEQVREETSEESGKDVAFIHQEVFNENDPSKGVRRELRAFHLETEPWVFVFDREGKLSSRIEGAFSAEELRRAVHKATS